MSYSTLFWSIYTIPVCSLMKNTKFLILPELKKSKYYVGTSMLKQNCSEYNLSKKNIQCPILLCFVVCKPTPYALSFKIQKFYT